MSNDIGYGAAAIKAGDVKYQKSLVNLLKQSTEKTDKTDTQSPPPAYPADAQLGRHLDIKA